MYAYAVATLSVAAVASLAAQSGRDTPRRPRMYTYSDTNSATAYVAYGKERLRRRPGEAADAFYWATRLDPRMADPFYLRALALEAHNPGAYRGDRKRRPLDSLVMLALYRDPFVGTRAEQEHFRALYPKALAPWSISDPRMLGGAWLVRGAYDMASRAFSEAIRRDSADVESLLGRASAWYYLARFDDAASDLVAAIRVMERRQEREFEYRSKAMLEYARGYALMRGRNADAALEAFGRAIAEDVSFYMAHVGLAAIATARGDTVTAANEYQLAVEISDDAATLHDHGIALMRLGKYEQAMVRFREAIAKEPYFALPYLALGTLEYTLGNEAGARATFQQFIARAEKDHPALDRIRQFLNAPSPEAASGHAGGIGAGGGRNLRQAR